jgi:hypothetical protein
MSTNIETREEILRKRQKELLEWLDENSVFHLDWDKTVKEQNEIVAKLHGIESRREATKSVKSTGGIEPVRIWNVD